MEAVVVLAPPELLTYNLEERCIVISNSRPASSSSRSARSSSLMTSDHLRFSATVAAAATLAEAAEAVEMLEATGTWLPRLPVLGLQPPFGFFDLSFLDGDFLLFSLTFCSLIISFSSSSDE